MSTSYYYFLLLNLLICRYDVYIMYVVDFWFHRPGCLATGDGPSTIEWYPEIIVWDFYTDMVENFVFVIPTYLLLYLK